MSDEQARRIEHAFSQQAAAFEDPHFNRVFAAEGEWMFAELPLAAEDLVLDMAAGTGLVSRQLAPSVRAVIALDATVAMLSTGKAAADEQSLSNIIFTRGDAADLPFLEASFDVVVTRFALHHFVDVDRPLAELVRCLRPGGRLAVADMVSDEDPEVAQRQNAIERERDASHTRMLRRSELEEKIEALGIHPLSVSSRSVERPLAPWLEQTQTSPEATARIIAAFEAELAGGPSTGMAPRLIDGERHFTQHFASVVGVKPG